MRAGGIREVDCRVSGDFRWRAYGGSVFAAVPARAIASGLLYTITKCNLQNTKSSSSLTCGISYRDPTILGEPVIRRPGVRRSV
jgi:hypothetical protein